MITSSNLTGNHSWLASFMTHTRILFHALPDAHTRSKEELAAQFQALDTSASNRTASLMATTFRSLVEVAEFVGPDVTERVSEHDTVPSESPGGHTGDYPKPPSSQESRFCEHQYCVGNTRYG